MVIAAISVLSILVTEFTYISQLNQKLAYDGLDQLQAHYLAKTGLKISLLRLKAYQNVKQVAGGMLKAAGADPKLAEQYKPLFDKIWSVPFYYPLHDLPGLAPREKEAILAFEKASGFEGKFGSFITSESGKYNLNSLLPGYVAPAPAPSAGPSGSPSGTPSSTPSTSPSTSPSFNPENARLQLKTFLGQLLQPKIDDDPQWADAYRDPHLLEDLTNNIAAWVDRKVETRTKSGDIPMKQAPFYSVSELHMIPGMDDDLYNLFAPNLTVSRTPGINVNTLQAATLKALFPDVTKEESDDFFKNRDAEDPDGTFKDEDGFFKYVKEHFQSMQRGDALDKLRKSWTDNGVRFVTEENEFKITSQGTRNQSTLTIEAWVTLNPPDSSKTPNPGASPNPQPNSPPPGNNLTPGATPPPPDPGLKIHFMKVT
jgi:general secretion pathway protein K